MKNIKKLEAIMSDQSSERDAGAEIDIMDYARTMAYIENAVVVVSSMADKTSHIFLGGFAAQLGISEYRREDSIWEKVILSRLSEAELDAKVISELRFYHYLKSKPKTKRDYHLLTRLRFEGRDGAMVDVAHRMYYIYDRSGDSVKYALCLYQPLTFDFRAKSVIINSVSGAVEELTSSAGGQILSRRERQVLSMIAEGRKSADIAAMLNVSVHTVSRHRQEILAKLQVKNSIEACRLARSMGLI